VTPAPQTAPAGTPKIWSGVGSMVAAGVAGAAVGAVAAMRWRMTVIQLLLSNKPLNRMQQLSRQKPSKKKRWHPGLDLIILIAAIAFFIFRKFSNKQKVAGNNPFAPNNSGNAAPFGQNTSTNRANSGDNTNIFGQSVGGNANAAPSSAPFGSAYTSGSQLPDGTEPATFLRVARQRFNHIQSVNSASNIEEIRRYLTPDLYSSMYNDIMANQDQDVAEFSNLNAMVVDSTTENGQYVVSVRFTGTVSEDLNSLPQPFSEIWHFVKPAGSSED
jgi:predicted lipid-binding transport protein (Tim44 family)